MSRDKQIVKRKQMSRELHSKTNTRLYNVWNNIKRRCYTKTNPSYKYYGGCGIGMCEEWRKSFSAFYEWSVKNGYNENAPKGECTIDRIDVNGDYQPSNCRWVSMKTQNLNRKANRIIEYNGETHTLVEWANILGINYSTRNRQNRKRDVGGGVMAYKRKYRQGEKITSLDDLAKQEFVYFYDKITHNGWFCGWQLRLAHEYIIRGCLYYAERIGENDEAN